MALNYSFKEKRVLITGGGQGIGRGLVERFHKDGATVFTIDKNSEAISELKKSLPGLTAEVVDICDWDATKKAIESFGVIDHLVNNAGVVRAQPFLNVTKEVATEQFNIDLLGIVNISQVVAKKLIAEGLEGSIVNVASITARRHAPASSIYGALKAGVENLTKSMAVELGPQKIRVNAITPGMVNTPMLHNSGATPEQLRMFLEAKLVLKKAIEPTEIADLVMFLLSPLSSTIVGESVVIDGGYLLK